MLLPIFATAQMNETTEENENALLNINDVYSFVFMFPLKMMIYKRGLMRSEATYTDCVEDQGCVF